MISFWASHSLQPHHHPQSAWVSDVCESLSVDAAMIVPFIVLPHLMLLHPQSSSSSCFTSTSTSIHWHHTHSLGRWSLARAWRLLDPREVVVQLPESCVTQCRDNVELRQQQNQHPEQNPEEWQYVQKLGAINSRHDARQSPRPASHTPTIPLSLSLGDTSWLVLGS